jgi:hypothetical protein
MRSRAGAAGPSPIRPALALRDSYARISLGPAIRGARRAAQRIPESANGSSEAIGWLFQEFAPRLRPSGNRRESYDGHPASAIMPDYIKSTEAKLAHDFRNWQPQFRSARRCPLLRVITRRSRHH